MPFCCDAMRDAYDRYLIDEAHEVWLADVRRSHMKGASNAPFDYCPWCGAEL